MRKKGMKIIGVLLMATLLSACGNTNSKVDQVVQDQIQDAEDKEKQNEDTGVTEEAANQEKQNEDTGAAEETAGPASGTTPDAATTQPEENEESVYVREPDASVDIDLTALSSTMVYSEVFNMLTVPDDYIGKTVKMTGMFVIYSNADQSQYYPAVIIADATACCSQGLEFVLKGNPPYPEGYPKLETDITVIGTFETYDEDGNTYCRLQNAEIV